MILEHKFPYLSLLFGTNALAGLIVGFQVLLDAEGMFDVLISLMIVTLGAICAIVLFALRKRKIWTYKLLIAVFFVNYALVAAFMYPHFSDMEKNISSFEVIFILIATGMYILFSGFITYHVYDEINNDLTKNI
jgi:lysylphosphatidylglycerol synthetase-like protein (DUF2156 family)